MARVTSFKERGIRVDSSGQSGPSLQDSRSYVLTRADIQRSPQKNPKLWRPPMTYSASGKDIHYPYGWYHYRQVGSTRARYLRPYLGPSVDSVPSLAGFDPGLRSRAEVAALSRLKDQRVNFSQAFAERDQTARLFGDSITRIARAALFVRSGQTKQALASLGLAKKQSIKSRGRNFGQTWLELQYGWKPLLQDIHGACEELDRRDSEDPNRYVVTVKGRASYRTMRNQTRTSSICPNIACHEQIKQSTMVRLDYKPSDLELSRLSSLGLTNPAYIAWELMPYSFVVDWALPIGNWLNVLDAALGYQFISGTRSEVNRLSSKRFGSGAISNIAIDSQYWHASSEEFSHSRVLYASSPFPRLPRFKNPVSGAHVANALALLLGAFSRK